MRKALGQEKLRAVYERVAGTGSTALLAARKFGKSGKVVLLDMSNGMIAVARDRVAHAVWLIPSISLGCRSVSVLPAFEQMGCRTIFKKHIGVPLWPFLVFVVEKPRAWQ